MTDKINFSGQRLKKIRESKGLNRADLAAIMNRQYGCRNITATHVTNWEEYGNIPVYDYILALRDSLNVTLDQFEGEREKASENDQENE